MSGRRGLSATDRVSAAVLGVLTLGVALVATIAFTSVARALTTNLDTALLREVEAYSAAIAPLGSADTRTLRDASRAYLAGRTGTDASASMVLIVRFADGHVISNSGLPLEDAPANAKLLDADTARRAFATLSYAGARYRTASAPVYDGEGATVAVFQAAAPTDELTSVAREFALALLLASVAVVLGGFAVSRIAARRALRPLEAMAQDASRITQSSLGERVTYAGPPDELGVLADALNDMLVRLEGAFDEQHRFVADASHELRTPVAVIRGHLELLGQPWTDEAGRDEALRVISEEITRMQRILDDLLALARLQSPPGRPFQKLEVPTMLAEAAARGRALGKRRFELACEPDLWVEGDPDLLDRALQNVVRNAVEHTGDDGRITLACTREGGIVRIEIADDGPGIREEDLVRVFDRFYRSGGPRPQGSGGSGLGLAIARQLVETHGGTIAAANAEDGGAVFTIQLPAVRA